jgi:4-hydroxybenzoyl-CoA thioesterase
MAYERTKLIRFAHCDPAGIVFYPRYTELCNEVVEDWFADGLGVPFPELHERRRLGVPAVRLEIDFATPSHYGDVLLFQLEVTEVGRTSLTLAIVGSCAGVERLRIRLKVVLLSLESGRPVALDDAWRARIAPFVVQRPARPDR